MSGLDQERTLEITPVLLEYHKKLLEAPDLTEFTKVIKEFDEKKWNTTTLVLWNDVLLKIAEYLKDRLKKSMVLNVGFELPNVSPTELTTESESSGGEIWLVLRFVETLLQYAQGRQHFHLLEVIFPFVASENAAIVYRALRVIYRIIKPIPFYRVKNESIRNVYFQYLEAIAHGFTKGDVFDIASTDKFSEEFLKDATSFKFHYYIAKGKGGKTKVSEKRGVDEKKEIVVKNLHENKKKAFEFFLDTIETHTRLTPIHEAKLWTKIRFAKRYPSKKSRIEFLKCQLLAWTILALYHNNGQTNKINALVAARATFFYQMLETLTSDEIHKVVKEELVFSFANMVSVDVISQSILKLLLPTRTRGVPDPEGYVVKQIRRVENGEKYDTYFSFLLRQMAMSNMGNLMIRQCGIMSPFLRVFPKKREKLKGKEDVDEIRLVSKFVDVLTLLIQKKDSIPEFERLGGVKEIALLLVDRFVAYPPPESPPKEKKDEKEKEPLIVSLNKKVVHSLLSILNTVFSSPTQFRDIRGLFDDIGYLKCVNLVLNHPYHYTGEVCRLTLIILSKLMNRDPSTIPVVVGKGVFENLLTLIGIVNKEHFDKGGLIMTLPTLTYSFSLNRKCGEEIGTKGTILSLFKIVQLEGCEKILRLPTQLQQYCVGIKGYLKNNKPLAQKAVDYIHDLMLVWSKKVCENAEKIISGDDKVSFAMFKNLVFSLGNVLKGEKDLCQIFLEKYLGSVFKQILVFPFLAETVQHVTSNPIVEIIQAVGHQFPLEVVKEIVRFSNEELLNEKIKISKENIQKIHSVCVTLDAFQTLFLSSGATIFLMDWKAAKVGELLVKVAEIEVSLKRWCAKEIYNEHLVKLKKDEENERIRAEVVKKAAEEKKKKKIEEAKKKKMEAEKKKEETEKTPEEEAKHKEEEEKKKKEEEAKKKEEEEKKIKEEEAKRKLEEEKRKLEEKLPPHEVLYRYFTRLLTQFHTAMRAVVFRCLQEKDRKRQFENGFYFTESLGQCMLVMINKLSEVERQDLKEITDDTERSFVRSIEVKIFVEHMHPFFFSTNHRNTNIFMLNTFVKRDGVKILLAFFREACLAIMENLGKVKDEELLKKFRFHNLALVSIGRFLQKLVNLDYIVRSPLTRNMMLHDSKFQASKFIRVLQLQVCNKIMDIWKHKILSDTGSTFQSMMINIVGHILRGTDDDEEEKKEMEEEAIDNMSLTQLCSMGFPLYKAKKALIRCRNNLRLATEWLLSYPDIPDPSKEKEENEMEKAMIMSLNNDENLQILRAEGIEWAIERAKSDSSLYYAATDLICVMMEFAQNDKEMEFVAKGMFERFSKTVEVFVGKKESEKMDVDGEDQKKEEEENNQRGMINFFLKCIYLMVKNKTKLRKIVSREEYGVLKTVLNIVERGFSESEEVEEKKKVEVDEDKDVVMEDKEEVVEKVEKEVEKVKKKKTKGKGGEEMGDWENILILSFQILSIFTGTELQNSDTFDPNNLKNFQKKYFTPEEEKKLLDLSILFIDKQLEYAKEKRTPLPLRKKRKRMRMKRKISAALIREVLSTLSNLSKYYYLAEILIDRGVAKKLINLPMVYRTRDTVLILDRILKRMCVDRSVFTQQIRDDLERIVPELTVSNGKVTAKSLLRTCKTYVQQDPEAFFMAVKASCEVLPGSLSISIKKKKPPVFAALKKVKELNELKEVEVKEEEEVDPVPKTRLTEKRKKIMMILIREILKFDEALEPGKRGLAVQQFDLFKILADCIHCREDAIYIVNFKIPEPYEHKEKSILEYLFLEHLPFSKVKTQGDKFGTRYISHRMSSYLLLQMARWDPKGILGEIAKVLENIEKYPAPFLLMSGLAQILLVFLSIAPSGGRAGIGHSSQQLQCVCKLMVGEKIVPGLSKCLSVLDLSYPDSHFIVNSLVSTIQIIMRTLDGVVPEMDSRERLAEFIPLQFKLFGYINDFSRARRSTERSSPPEIRRSRSFDEEEEEEEGEDEDIDEIEEEGEEDQFEERERVITREIHRVIEEREFRENELVNALTRAESDSSDSEEEEDIVDEGRIIMQETLNDEAGFDLDVGGFNEEY